MTRRAAPLAVALAVSLACPEVFASPFGRVPSNMSFQSAQPTETIEAGPGTIDAGPEAIEAGPGVIEAGPAAPAPQPYSPGPGPQPYADPTAPGVEGPEVYAAPAAYAPPPSYPRKRRKGLMIGGWTMFGSSYLATAFVAAIVHDTCNVTSNPSCKNAATMALIPAVGPLMAIPHMRTEAITPKVLMAFPSFIQLAGLTMAIIGTVQFVRDGREPRYVDVDGVKLGSKLRLGVAPTRFLDGGSLTLGARF